MKFTDEEIYMIEELLKKKKVFYNGISIFEKVTYFLETIGLKKDKDFKILKEFEDWGVSLTESGKKYFKEVNENLAETKEDENPVHTNKDTNKKIKFFNTLIALEGKLK